MRVLDLLDRAELRISVVWAEPAMLEREIKGSYIIDMPDPARFVSEGDLVLTAGLWATGPESAHLFVSALAEKSASALLMGRILRGYLPDEIESACRQHGIVLLTVEPDVSYKSITQFIESTAEDGLGTSRSGTLSRSLLEGLGTGVGVQGALRSFHDEFGIGCWVLESGGEVTAAAGAAPGVEWIATVWNRMLQSTAEVVTLVDPLGRVTSVWPVGSDGERPVGYFACATDHRSWPTDVGRVVSTLLVVTRVELELANKRRQAEHAQAAELVGLLASDSLSPGEASARLRLLGADPLEPVTVIAGRVDDDQYPTRAVLSALASMVSGIGTTEIGCEYEGEAVIFVGGPDVTPEKLIAAGEKLGDRYRGMLDARHLRIGVSERTLSISQLGSALSSARARMRAAAGDETITWASRSTPLSSEALLDLVPERVRSAFARGLLAPLVDYDSRHGSELVQTLRVFLDSGAAWQQAAAELHVHVNTLRYRVTRIEQLTDRDLGTMSDRVDLYLALASLPASGGSAS